MEIHILFFVAAVAAGAINTLAGGGGLPSARCRPWSSPRLRRRHEFSRPAPRLSYRRVAHPPRAGRVRRRWLWLLLATSVVGGLAGALMLVRTDDRNFVFLMPWLVLGRSRSARSLRRDTFCSSP